ncbi:RHS domain-containing protein, partial [Reinekea forsetii]|nr:RHS domain-containing protein [Reinekea forsetii]
AIRIGDDSNNPVYASVTWPITVPQTGRYKVYGTWNSGSSRASNAKYTINAGPNQHTSIQNQRLNGGQWNLLGEYSFDIADNQNGQNNVSLSAEANGYLIADAIKLELVEDNQPAPSGLFFIHNDHLGTPKRLTDTQGQVVWSLQTTPFGEIHEEIANGITLLNGFPGQYRDSETDLSYNYYRDYDPSIGRYIESDPVGLGGGLNTYGYVGGNPVGYLDPYGLEIAVQVHEVAAGNYHSSIILTPEYQANYQNNPLFTNVNSDGKLYATLGAGSQGIPSINAELVSAPNRPTDLDLSTKVESATLALPPGYSEAMMINKLLSMDRRYCDNLFYELFPEPKSVMNGYNSNSYISGLVGAAGMIAPLLSHKVPGYNNPLPFDEFTCGCQ